MTHPLIPLLILTVLLSVGAFIGYTIYTIANDVAQKTAKKMEQKNVSFSKDGLRVGVKEVQTENYVAKTQSILVNIWNASTWPAYKSRLGWNKERPQKQH